MEIYYNSDYELFMHLDACQMPRGCLCFLYSVDYL